MVKVSKPANDLSILCSIFKGTVITDRLAVDYNVAFVRSGSPNQLNH